MNLNKKKDLLDVVKQMEEAARMSAAEAMSRAPGMGGAPGMGAAPGMGKAPRKRASSGMGMGMGADEGMGASSGMGGDAGMGMGGAPGVGGGRSGSDEDKIRYNVFGDVTLTNGSKRTKLKDTDDNLLKDGDMFATGESSYVWGISDAGGSSMETATLVIFPNSEAVISMKGKKIASMELVRGLFSVGISTSGDIWKKLILPSRYPKFEFKPMFGDFKKQKQVSGNIELMADGSLVLFSSMNKIVYGDVETDIMSVNQPKITIRKDGMYVTNLVKYPDSRVEAANKMFFAVSEYLHTVVMKAELDKGSFDYKGYGAPLIDEIEANAKQRLKEAKETEDPSLVAMAESGMAALEGQKKALKEQWAADEKEAKENAIKGKEAVEKKVAKLGEFERKAKAPLPQYSPLRAEDKLTKKDVTRLGKGYGDMIGELMNKQKDLEEKYIGAGAFSKATPQGMLALELGSSKAKSDFKDQLKATMSQKGLMAITKSADMCGKFTYRGSDYVLTRVEKGTELKFQKSPRGKEFLIVQMKITNKTIKEVFLDPSLMYALVVDGAVLKADNYTIKTNIDPGKETEGYLLFLVPEDAKTFAFRYGYGSEPKKDVRLDL